MAILRGFPPSNTISPSVRIAEKDLSFVPPEQSFHRAGIVGFCSKGPINIPTVIRTRRQLNTVFGYPHPETSDPYLIYAAEQYLLIANELYVVRVADEDAVSHERAQTAEVDVPSAGGLIEIVSDQVGPYTFSKTMYFRWRLNGILASKTLFISAGTYTATELAEDLNLLLVTTDGIDTTTTLDIDGIEFYATNDGRIGVRTTFSYGPNAHLELVSVQDAMYGGPLSATGTYGAGTNINNNITGLAQASTIAQVTGGEDRYPNDGYQVAGTYDLTGISDVTLNVVIDGTDNVTIDNVVQEIDLSDIATSATTVAEVVSEINDQIDDGTLAGGFEAVAVGNNLSLRSLHSGRDARLLVKSDSGLFTVFGFDTPHSDPTDHTSALGTHATAEGTTTSGTSGAVNIHQLGWVYGASALSGIYSFTCTADTAGIEGNDTQIKVTNDVREGVFTIEVYNNSVQMESWGYLTKDSTSRYYVETFLTLVSDFIRVVDNTSVAAPPLNGTYSLSGGTDGIPADPDDQDALVIGNSLGYTGMYALSEPEQIEIDLLACPGHSSTDVIMTMIDVCQNYRMDCLAIVDPPFGLTVKEIVQWQNGTHPLNTTRFNSDFAAMYWPWLKLRDTYNQVDVWVPPSGSVLAVYARNDQFAEPWFAPAGVNRGIVPSITDVYSRPTLEERDEMYGNRNCINPIVQFADYQDYVVWGQKTMQRRPTALDRVNVRRMLFVLEKRIRAASRQLLFDPHDEIFRRKFIDIATGICREVQVGRGLTDFIIQADEELNTPDVIDRNEFRARIGVQPTRAVEFIFIEFSVHRTGSFSENADTVPTG